MRPLLTQDDCARIEEAIAKVEKTTAGEIVLAVAQRSHDYAFSRALFTGILTLAWAFAAYFGGSALLSATGGEWGEAIEIPPAWILLGQLPVAAILWWVCGWPPLLRVLAPDQVEIAAVATCAKDAFLDYGLVETRERSGVLIYISQLERRVHILADAGIHERAGVEEWEKDVQTIVDGIKRGTAAEGILAAVGSIGAQLAESFPRSPDDVNELPNHVVFL
jgi:putative membrane protein